ncbi:hypothetical protein GE061_015926 [Apolygus lucorum]|uniref:Uncharacterized protein n=1 Tax=Apolygus lucorum TaxID=248454 RepID=A0A8S9XEJ4_APOLU|nr:hypothetical protein GE061_015926 [Apolygus lucorum]
MPVCVPCMGLGVRHIQYSLYAFLISIEFWLQELAIKSLLKIDADSSSSSSGGQYINVSKEEMATVQQMVFLCFAVGRITSAFVCLKFNNKYLLIGLIVFESLVVSISFWFIKQMNIVFFVMFFGSVSFSRSFHWTLVFNMMSKWMTPSEYTTAYALMIVTRETLSFVMKFFLASTKDVDQSRLFLFVVTVFYIAWAMLFLVFGAEGPETSFLLSRIEHAYLAKCIGPRKKSRCSSKAPWKSIFGTLILYGWLFADFGRECCVTVISDGFQIVLEELAGASLAGIQVGLCLAYLAILGSAVLSDKLIVKELLTPGQYLLYATLFAIGIGIQEITLHTLKKSNAKGEGDANPDGFWNMSSTEEGRIRQALFLSFALGRITSAFVCLKINNKYVLLGFIIFETIGTNVTFWLVGDRNIFVVGILFAFMSFTRAFQWTFVVNMLAKWAPPGEYTTANAVIVVIRETTTLIMRFLISKAQTLDDTKVILIFFSTFYVVWFFVYLVVGAEGPNTSFLLSKIEHVYLAKYVGPRKRTRCSSKTPWKPLFKTVFLYGWVIADFGRESSTTVMTDGFQLAIDEFEDIPVAGVHVGLIFSYAVILGSAVLSDKLIIKELLTPGQVRKIYSSVGCCGTSISMILSAYSEKTPPTFGFIVVGVAFASVMSIGQPVAIYDISPNYAAVIFAIFTFIRQVIFVIKVAVDVNVQIYPLTQHNFDEVFYRYGFLVFITNLIFLLCGDIERKPFDTYDTQDWTKESIISYP